VAVVRELTKLHEEVIRGTTLEVAAVLEQRVILGEIVVVLEGGEPVIDVDDELVRRALREQFSTGVSTRDAVDFVSETLGASHRVVYQMALEVKKDATS
jgi:16S rRNA (cytidine1402-2'-O)-methyltransferase